MLFIKDESALHSYLEKWVQKRLGKAVFRRHFLATVLTVSGVPGKYVVTVQRLDERQPDPNTYLCSNPGYIPQVGDTVDVLWFDDTLGYVMWPLAGRGLGTVPYFRYHRLAAFTSTSSWARVPMDVIDDDPLKAFTAGSFTCPATLGGVWQISGRISYASAGTRVITAIWDDATAQPLVRGQDQVGATPDGGGVAAALCRLVGGQSYSLGTWTSAASTADVGLNPDIVCYLTGYRVGS